MFKLSCTVQDWHAEVPGNQRNRQVTVCMVAQPVMVRLSLCGFFHSSCLQVYSHNTDKLVDREVSFSRGTGGAVLLMHARLVCIRIGGGGGYV